MTTAMAHPPGSPASGSAGPAPGSAERLSTARPGSLVLEAVRALVAAVGEDHVHIDSSTIDRYARGSDGRAMPPVAVVCPDSTKQVQAVVRIAGKHDLPLYPISRGKNWGYGDARAGSAGQIILDLSRMNRIIEVNEKLAYAVIEPGVTQGQLCQYLQERGIDLWIDATGASVDASVVGNTVDRGFGHTPYGDHFQHTCGMDVVLADGALLQTGYGHYENAKADRVYRYGVGPFLDGLFAQSNYGIVTRIGLWLMPKPEAFTAFFVQPIGEASLGDLVDRLAHLRRRDLLTSAIHIGNDLRVISARLRYPFDRTGGQTPLPPEVRRQICEEQGITPWNAAGAICGSKGTVRAVKRELQKSLRGYRLRFVDDRKFATARRVAKLLGRIGLGSKLAQQLGWLEPVYALMKGEPNNDALGGMLWRVRPPRKGPEVAASDQEPPLTDPLASPAGFMWVSPVLPNDGESAQAVMDLLEPTYEAFGFEALVTFTMISPRAIMCVSNLAFDKRDADEASRALACYEALYQKLIDAGYIPYRSGHHGQQLLQNDSTYWQVARRIKDALDPQGLLSPGRYV